jgi:hypothetical protein
MPTCLTPLQYLKSLIFDILPTLEASNLTRQSAGLSEAQAVCAAKRRMDDRFSRMTQIDDTYFLHLNAMLGEDPYDAVVSFAPRASSFSCERTHAKTNGDTLNQLPVLQSIACLLLQRPGISNSAHVQLFELVFIRTSAVLDGVPRRSERVVRCRGDRDCA